MRGFVRAIPMAWLMAWVFWAGATPETADYSGGLLDRSDAVAVAKGITCEVYPNSDTVVIDELIRDEYAPDGTSVTWDDEYIKVLTEKGKRELQTRSRYYTLPYGTAAFKLAEIFKPDGTCVRIDLAEQCREMVDRSQMNMNIYNPNSKIVKLSVPGLEIGDTVHLVSVEYVVKARVPDTWSEYEVFEYTSPIKHLVYEVHAPRELPPCNIALRDEVPGTVTATRGEADGKLVYRWDVKDVPRMYEEPKMPPLHTVVQRLLLSTIPTWQDISKWYWNLSLPHLEKTTPEMKEKVAELTRGVADRRDKIRKIFTFVSQDVRYMGITTETEAPGYEPHDVSTTFRNRYGVCRDKAALLVAMLRLADIEAYPVLIHNGPKKDVDVPQPYFNHAIAATAEGGGRYSLMDPTDENTTDLLPSYLCNQSYLVAHPEGEKLRTSPIVPATNNLVTIESRGYIDEDGDLSMESTLSFTGINDNAYRGYFSRLKPEERRRFFEGALKRRLAGAHLTRFELTPEDIQDTSEPMKVALGYEAPDYLVAGEDYAIVPPPWLGTVVGFVNFVLRDTGLEKRKYPLETEVACGVTEHFNLDLGTSVGPLVSCPESAPIDTNDIVFARGLTVDAGHLVGDAKLLLNAVEFSPDAYLGLKRVLRDMEYDARKRAIFKAAPHEAAEHDVRIEHAALRVDFADARNWTSRQTVVQKILTYAGKKSHSELKLNYNPVWESVELGEISVTSADGSVHIVTNQEVNVMDAAWVGAAPRYPGAKTMVVSLPGVELGSTIRYEVIYHNHDFPFFSMSHEFQGFEPIDESSLTLTAPETMTPTILDLTGDKVRFEQSREGDRVVYCWKSGAQKALKKEDALPPLWSFVPTVFVSTGEWSAYVSAMDAAFRQACTNQPDARRIALELVKELTNDTAKVTAIRDYVARNVRHAGPQFTELPMSAMTPADRTLAEGYGNDADSAIVLCAMLDAAGLYPEPILTSSWAPHVPLLLRPNCNCPQRKLLDSLLVRVTVDEWPIYLNDTDQYARLGTTSHDRRFGFSMDDGKPVTVGATPEEMENRSRVMQTISLAPDGAAAISVTREYYGTSFAAFHRHFSELPPEERRRHFQELVSGVSQGAVAAGDLTTDYSVYPGVKRFAVKAERYAVRSGAYLYVTVPDGLGDILPLRSDARTGALYRAEPLRASDECTIELPDGVTDVCLLPEDASWELPAELGTVTFETQVKTADNGRKSIVLARTVDLKSAVVPPEDYQQLLDMNRRIKHPSMWTVMVKVGE